MRIVKFDFDLEAVLGKEEFIKALIDKGYDAVSDNGVVMVNAPVEKLGDIQSDMVRMAEKFDYKSSFGVRLKNGRQDNVL